MTKSIPKVSDTFKKLKKINIKYQYPIQIWYGYESLLEVFVLDSRSVSSSETLKNIMTCLDMIQDMFDEYRWSTCVWYRHHTFLEVSLLLSF